MAQAPRTTVTYKLDGANRDFQLPFEYLARKFVQVTLVGVDRKVLTLNIDYRFTQRTIITLTKNWGPSDGYSLIEVRRYTSATERLVDFSDGSILRAYDLNTSQVQSLHIAEEGRDIATDTIGVNNDGNLDARGRKIVNVADGTGDFDAVNLRQQKQWAGSALNQADRAQREADRSTQQANASQASNAASAAQAQESLKWANESSRHAGLSKASAEASQTSNVQSFQNLQAAQAQVAEATRQAGLATSNGAAQVALATTQANRSRDEANRSTGQATASAASAGTSKTEADRSTREANRAKTEADKLGNMNSLAAAIREVNVAGKKVEVVGEWEWNADVMAINRIRSRSSDTIRFDAQLVGALGATFAQRIATSADIQAAGEVAAGAIVRIRGQGANAHLWFMDPQGVENALIYADPSGALHIRSRSQADTLTLNADRSTVAGGDFRVAGASSTAARHTAGELLSNGKVWSGGGQSWVETDGNVHGPVWGGYLSNWVTNQIAGKQPKYVYQAGRLDIGAPGGTNVREVRVNFHTPIGDPVINCTVYSQGGWMNKWGHSIKDVSNAGFTVTVQAMSGQAQVLHWMACNPTNV